MKKILSFILFLGLAVLSFGGSALAAEQNTYEKSDPWVYTITRKTVITNPGKNDIRNVRVTTPLMDTSQPVYQDLLGEELSPWPTKIVESSTGTRQAIFEIPVIKPGGKIIITQRYGIRNYAVNFNIESWQVSSDYSDEKIDIKYLQPETKIESDHPLIVNYARDLVKNETNPYLKAQKLFADINLFMTYKDGPNANKGALNAIRTGEGNCEDYTNLFIAAARAVGIPARWKTGYLYLPKEYNAPPYIKEDGSLDITLMRHTWPEIYLPNVGWMVLDPTFTYTIKSGKRQEKAIDWSKFGRITSSSRHIFFSYGSHDDGYIELNYSGPKPKVEFSESLVFGNNVFPFRDATNHWAKDSIMFLTEFTPKIIGGYGNGLFGPDDRVTRAQLAAMLNRVLSLDYHVGKPQFSDVSPGYWGYADIAAAKGAGIVAGFPDGTFRPEKQVTRAELAVIFDRAFDLPYPAAGISFLDLGKPGFAWADASIIRLAGNGIAAGYPGGLFLPEKSVTRAEVAVFLSRILDSMFRLKVK
ncbi:MAG: S-layer homology domain-containing protein [Bacillota bacterium]